jgi:hypothetical protein
MISPFDDSGNYTGKNSTGLIAPTPSQRQAQENWWSQQGSQTSDLPLTDIGLQRINQERQNQGLPAVTREGAGSTIGGLIGVNPSQQQQMSGMRARDMAMAQLNSRGTPISYGGESPGFGRGLEHQPAYQPAVQDQPQIRPYRTGQLSGLPANRVGVPSMSQLMEGIYGGGGMGRNMGGGFNPYMGGGGMGFGGFNPYMGGRGMGGFNPYMGGRGMGRGMGFGGFNPYMAQPQPMPMPMQLPDFARQMYGIGQRANPYASMERIMPYVPPRETGPGFGGIMPVMNAL